jgi:hypothetical protein
MQEFYPVPGTPLWSPVGHQFVVDVHDRPEDQDYFRMVLVDIDKGFAAQIAENQWIWGWMVSP